MERSQTGCAARRVRSPGALAGAARLAALLAFAAACSRVSAGLEALEDPEANLHLEEFDARGSVCIAARGQDVNFSLQTTDESAVEVDVGYRTTESMAFGGEIAWGNSTLSYFEDGALYYSMYGRRYSFDAYYYDRTEFEYDTEMTQQLGVFDYDPEGLYAKGFGASLLYVFSPEKFSFPAAYGYTERHVASCGSFIGIASTSRYEVGASDPLIPPALQSYYGDAGTIRRAEFFTLSIAGGYAGTLVLSPRRYVVGSATLGFGRHSYEYDTDTATNSGSAGTLKAVFHMGYGYDRGPFFVRMLGKVDWEVNFIDEIDLAFQHLNGTFTFGARF